MGKVKEHRRVFLLSRYGIIRAGLKQILGLAKDWEFGEADGVEKAIRKMWKGNWDLMIVDFSTEASRKLELIKQLRSHEEGFPTLIISPDSADSHLRRGLRAGAVGYLQWEEVETHLPKAMARIESGQTYIDPALGALLLSAWKTQNSPHERLSDRQFQVLCLLAEGKRAVEVAAQMALSPKTVHTHRKSIEKKMQLRTYEEYARYGRQHGLVE